MIQYLLPAALEAAPAGTGRMTVMPAPHDAAVDDPAVPGTPAAGAPAAAAPPTEGRAATAAPTQPGPPGPGPASGETAADLAALRATCTRFLTGHGAGRAADLLATIPPDTQTDRYGEGGVVTELESEVMLVLGKPAAVFLPSGTMAQQAVLRVHADRRQRRVIVFHPACHIDTHEGRGYERLHQLTGRPAGEPGPAAHRGGPGSGGRARRGVGDRTAAARSRRPAAGLGRAGSAGGLGPGARRGGASGRRAAVGVRGGLRQAAGRDRRPVRHRVRVVLQGARGAAGLLRGGPGGHRRRGARVAAPDGRDAVRPVAERGVGAVLPGPAAAR